MKLFLTILLTFGFAFTYAQSTVFSDNFESGTSSWVLTNNWASTTLSSHSTSHSLTESPGGNYTDNETSYATLATGINLSSALNANLSFWAKYNIEGGFDYMYLDVSPNGGTTWIQVDVYDDTLSNWTLFSYPLGGYVGNSNVKIRFRFVSDGYVNFDGMYIDDVVVTSDTTDQAAPLILHTEPAFYQSTLAAYAANADIIDISGLSYTQCFYSVDGSTYDSISYSNLASNTYTFTIPQQDPGSLIKYYFKAIDSAATPNIAISDTFRVIQGNYISYDNAQVDFVDSTGAGGSAAVKVTLPGPCQLTTMLIRNYTDQNRPNDSMLVHVWSDNNGMPGTDLITPFKVYPTANLQNTSAMTVIDLRSDSVALSGISGDVFVGFSVPSGGVWMNITQPGLGGRSYKFNGTTWALATGTSGNSDLHIRAITSSIMGLPDAQFSVDYTNTPSISFTDSSSDANTWKWKFGDGSPNSIQQHPSHTYQNNGNFAACLIAGNAVGFDTLCKSISIQTYLPPVSAFTFSDSLSPSIYFFDNSANNPNSWIWKFDYNGMASGQQNPMFTFPAASATYNVCLTTASINGQGDTTCQSVVIVDDTGIDDAFKSSSIKIVPNPFVDKTTIQIEYNSSKPIIFNIYDSKGALLKVDYHLVSDGILLERGALSSGSYIFEIIQNDQKQTGQLIIR